MMVNTTNVVKRYFRSNVRSTFKEIFGYQNQKHLNFCIVFGIICPYSKWWLSLLCFHFNLGSTFILFLVLFSLLSQIIKPKLKQGLNLTKTTTNPTKGLKLCKVE